MRRRVAPGETEQLSGNIDSREATVLGWTDGVADIISYFVTAPTGELLEFQFAAFSLPAPEHGAAADVASVLLPSLEWRRAS